MIEKNVVVEPFQCNCRVLVEPNSGDALVIDPGDEASKILGELRSIEKQIGKPVQLRYLLHTHAHLDHIGATRKVKEGWTPSQEKSPEIFLHADDKDLYRNLKMQCKLFGLDYGDPLPVDKTYQDEQELKLGDAKLSVIHTPGHSPGSVCLRLHENSAVGAPEKVFSGDTLFQGSIGRTDLWGGDYDLLLKSIRQRIFTLDSDTPICPGHGPDTSVGIEKSSNPFLT